MRLERDPYSVVFTCLSKHAYIMILEETYASPEIGLTIVLTQKGFFYLIVAGTTVNLANTQFGQDSGAI